MNVQDTGNCSLCSAYLLSLLSEPESQKFEAHLVECKDCQRELAELQPVVNVLPFSAELLPLPAELKQRTLRAAFEIKPPVKKSADQQLSHTAAKQPSAWHLFVTNRYGKIAAGLVATLTISLAASLFQLNQINQRLESSPIDRPTPTTRVDRSLQLYSTNNNAHMSGAVYLTDTNEGAQLIIQVQNAPLLTGEQAYQVWLLKNGQRINAGTFRVNENGTGILVFTSGSVPSFDNIGITLEPDANGTEPRGPKVLGTNI